MIESRQDRPIGAKGQDIAFITIVVMRPKHSRILAADSNTRGFIERRMGGASPSHGRTELAGRTLENLRAPSGENDGGPAPGQFPRCRASEARSPARHQDDLPVEQAVRKDRRLHRAPV